MRSLISRRLIKGGGVRMFGVLGTPSAPVHGLHALAHKLQAEYQLPRPTAENVFDVQLPKEAYHAFCGAVGLPDGPENYGV